MRRPARRRPRLLDVPLPAWVLALLRRPVWFAWLATCVLCFVALLAWVLALLCQVF